MNFGRYPGSTYNEAWSWICAGRITVNVLLSGCDLLDARVLNFTNWMRRMRQVVCRRMKYVE